MKKYFIPILLIVMMSGCKEDLTDYLNRVDSRESANESLRKENAELEKQNDAQAKWNAAIAEMYARLELESEELAERLRILEQEGSAPSEPKLLKIEFLAADNTDIVGICAGAVHTAFVCAADITATTAVQIIILNVHTAVAAHHRIIRTGRIT